MNATGLPLLHEVQGTTALSFFSPNTGNEQRCWFRPLKLQKKPYGSWLMYDVKGHLLGIGVLRQRGRQNPLQDNKRTQVSTRKRSLNTPASSSKQLAVHLWCASIADEVGDIAAAGEKGEPTLTSLIVLTKSTR